MGRFIATDAFSTKSSQEAMRIRRTQPSKPSVKASPCTSNTAIEAYRLSVLPITDGLCLTSSPGLFIGTRYVSTVASATDRAPTAVYLLIVIAPAIPRTVGSSMNTEACLLFMMVNFVVDNVVFPEGKQSLLYCIARCDADRRHR